MIIKNQPSKIRNYLFVGLLFIFFTLFITWQYHKNINPHISIKPSAIFHNNSFECQINHSSRYKIYYTTDGSIPNLQSNKYTKPFPINQTSIIKSQAYNFQDKKVGEVIEQTYFVNTTHQLPITQLVFDPEDFFSKDKGIYIQGKNNIDHFNYLQKGNKWQKNITFKYYKDNHLELIHPVETKIHGGGSRSAPKKSLRLTVKKDNQQMYQNFFDNNTNRFHTLILRNGGNDWQYLGLRDALIQHLFSQTSNIDTQAFQPTVVYLNDKYWGIYNLREYYDEFYFANKYHILPQDVAIVEIPHETNENKGMGILKAGEQQDVDEYNQLYKQTLKKNFGEGQLNKMTQKIDINNFIDHIIAELYSGNVDWPFGNVIVWKYKTDYYHKDAPYGLDGRWRFTLIDLDYCFALGNANDDNPYRSNNLYRLLDDKFPFKNFFKVGWFTKRFNERLIYHLNYTLHPNRVYPIIADLKKTLEPEINTHLNRWKNEKDTINDLQMIQNQTQWEHEFNLVKNYVREKPKIFINELSEYLKMDQTYFITVKSNIKNPNLMIDDYPIYLPNKFWQGVYFNNQFIQIKAQDARNWKFSHWEIENAKENKNNEINLRVKNNEKIKAIYTLK